MRKRLVAITASVALTFGLIALPAAAQAVNTTTSAGKASTVVVQLVGPSGKPLLLKNSAVVLLGGATSNYSRSEAHFNSHGLATLKNVRSGTTVVRAYVPGQQKYAFGDKTIVVKTGKKVTVRIGGSIGASISGTVRADSTTGRLVDNVMVTAIPVKGGTYRPVWAYTDRQGKYTVTGLNSGTYKLSFGVPTDAPALANYIGNYWKGAPNASGGQTITLQQQSATKSAHAVSNVNDVLVVGHRLTVQLAPATPGTLGSDVSVTFQAVRGTSNLDTVGATPADATENAPTTAFTHLLVPGTFIVVIKGAHTYYYAGEGKPYTTDKSQAAVVVFHAKVEQTIHFGPAE